MKPKTKQLWDKQDRHPGDRWRLFRSIADAYHPKKVLYPGSYVDVAPSFVFPDVTYVDVDRRAAAFFEDMEGVQEIIKTELLENFVCRTPTPEEDVPNFGRIFLVSEFFNRIGPLPTFATVQRSSGFRLKAAIR